MRRDTVELVRKAIAENRRAYVLVNNRSEGNAPLTIRVRTIDSGMRQHAPLMSRTALSDLSLPFSTMVRSSVSGGGRLYSLVFATPASFRDLLPLFWNTFQVKKWLDLTRPAGVLEHHILSCHCCAKLGAPCEPRVRHRPLASLTPEDGLHFVKARMEEGAAAGTIRREGQVFTRILNLAVHYDWLLEF